MTPYRKRQCKITQRLAEDMMIRHLAETTVDMYTYRVRKFADFIGKPLEQVNVEDVGTFQLDLIQERKLPTVPCDGSQCSADTKSISSSNARPIWNTGPF